jgi:hypothetical protein
MSAIQQIVDAYVRLGARQSLEELLTHRQRLAANLEQRPDFDVSLSLRQIEEEIRVVLSGLNKLRLDGSGASETTEAGHVKSAS